MLDSSSLNSWCIFPGPWRNKNTYNSNFVKLKNQEVIEFVNQLTVTGSVLNNSKDNVSYDTLNQ